MKKTAIQSQTYTEYLLEANSAYPEHTIAHLFDLQTGAERHNPLAFDTLALFIGREIKSVIDLKGSDEDNRLKIIDALDTAKDEIERVIQAIGRKL